MASSILPASYSLEPDYFVDHKLDTADDVLIVAAQAKLLSKIARDSFSDPVAAAHMLGDKLPLHLCHPAVVYLRAAVLEQAARHMAAVTAAEFTEFDVHRHFWNQLEGYIPGAKRASRPTNRQHVPDGWILLGDEYLPVEIKKGDFSPSSVRQIHRYMNFYGALRGVAVAKEFTADPGDAVICVRYDIDAVAPGAT